MKNQRHDQGRGELKTFGEKEKNLNNINMIGGTVSLSLSFVKRTKKDLITYVV
jgi:hypothetical protein